MAMNAKISWICIVLAGIRSIASAEEPINELDVVAAVGPDFSAMVTLSKEMPLYSSNRADRVVDRLPAGQRALVLVMDEHGVKVEARTPRGALRGWVSRKGIAKGDQSMEAKMESWYQREIIVAALVKSKMAALNLTAAEMARIFGPPSRRSLAVEENGGGTRERLEWIRAEDLKVDKSMKGALAALSGDTSLTRVETARLTVEILNGMVRSVDGSITETAAVSPQPVAPPVPCPFDLVPAAPSAR